MSEVREPGSQRIGYAILVAYLFILFSRVVELTVPALRVAAMLYGAGILGLLISGGFLLSFRNRIAPLLLAYIGWMLLSAPFSIWKGGSFECVIKASKALPVFFLVAGLLAGSDRLRSALHTIAYATLVLAVLALNKGQAYDGRLGLEDGRFANPNDLAQVLILGGCFWLCMAMYSGASKLRRSTAVCALLMLLFLISKTGSRGGMLTVAAIALAVFLSVSGGAKLKMAGGGGILLLVLLVLMPETLKTRYLTFFHPEQTSPEMDADERVSLSAAESAESRMRLLRTAIELTLRHPLLGVGPAMYPVAEKDLAESRGARPYWHDAHNTYAQVSSEMGVPAFVFYLGILILSLKTSRSVWKTARGRPEARMQSLANTALAINLALISYSVSSLFSSVAYSDLLPTLAGLAIVLDRCLSEEMQRLKPSQEPAARPGPWPPRLVSRLRGPAARLASARRLPRSKSLQPTNRRMRS